MIKLKISTIFIGLICSVMIASAQTAYPKLWESVKAYEQKGLPKSALKVVEKIYKISSREKNDVQKVKSLIYKSKYVLILEEDAQLSIVNDFITEIATAKDPIKNVLECLLADLYWQFFQQNSYRFYNRTSTLSEVSEDFKVQDTDFRTWSLPEIYAAIHFRFQNALSGQESLKYTKLTSYDELLHLEENSKTYRPTLFDFVSHNALKFYKTPENTIAKNVSQFELTEKDYETVDNFGKDYQYHNDLKSNELHALKIYDELLKFHKKTNNQSAYGMVALERLKFIHENLGVNAKLDSLQNQLQKLLNNYQNHEISSLIAFELANVYHQKAEKYTSENTQYQFERKKSLEICRKASKQFPESLGAKKCGNLATNIQRPTASLLTERFLPVCKSSKLLLTYSNLDSIYLNIFQISNQQEKNFGEIRKDEQRVEFIRQLKKVHSNKHLLKNEQDYQEHQTEILIPELDNHQYLMLVTENPTLNSEDFFATSLIQVTDFSIVQKNKSEQHRFQVINRNTGKPIQNAIIILKNEPKQKYNRKISKQFKTDKLGEFSFKTSAYHSNVTISVKKNKEQAHFKNYYLNENRKPRIREEQKSIKPFVFTDRSIYRPGQTVHFKAILVEKIGGNAKTLDDQKITATLFNVNHEEIASKELITNEFGSVSSSYVLPGNGLTGLFRLMIKTENQEYSSTNFSVEAYKRPKFEASFKPIRKTYRLNDRVNVIGKASSFSGTAVSNAKVSYRVYRKAIDWFIPYRSIWRPIQNSETTELAHGEFVTDEKGEFNIDFLAKPDSQTDKKWQPVFSFVIEAEVTDINGETRTAQTNLNIGYHTLKINASIENKIDLNQKNHTIEVGAFNLNEEKVQTSGNVMIHKLIPPNRVLRKRPWKAPDYKSFSKKTYQELFPNEAYHDEETQPESWEKGKRYFQKTVDIDGEASLVLSKIKNWPIGNYLLEIESKDRHDQKVMQRKVFSVFNSKKEQVSENELFEITIDKEYYQPGETVRLKIGSNAEELHVTLAVERKQQIIDQKVIRLNNETKFLDFKTTEQDLGGFAIKYSYSAYNQFDSGVLQIPVAKKQERIEIEVQTFRDKISPGEKEQWSFKIKGNKKDKIAAELLASMYDASLDQFKPHRWKLFENQPKSYSSRNYWSAHNAFGTSSFSIYNPAKHQYNNSFQEFDRFNWFGLSFGNSYAYRPRPLMSSNVVRKSFLTNQQTMEMSESRENFAGEALPKADVSVGQESENDLQLKEKNAENQQKKATKSNFPLVKVRTNFNENAFFYPKLKTDQKGNISFGFKAPEVLTQWKLQLLAHTQKAQFAYKELETVTQKELMVFPNLPRFARHGDAFELRTKVASLVKKSMDVQVELKLFDALSGKEIMINQAGLKLCSLKALGNSSVTWKLNVPYSVQVIQYKIVATSAKFSDGEQGILPVLSNRKLVTETLPMFVRAGENKSFELNKLKNNRSKSLQNHGLTLEVLDNPAWVALQSLPYLMELPFENSEQIFARFFANSIASNVLKSNSQVQKVVEIWKLQEASENRSQALLSNLEKNEELKSIIIAETPWLREAKDEAEQKKRLSLLFDKNRVADEQKLAIEKLAEMQFPDGGFSWFPKSRFPNRYITQYIATGFAQLQKIGELKDKKTDKLLTKALSYLDAELLNDYQKITKKATQLAEKLNTNSEKNKVLKEFWSSKHIQSLQVHYLFMRSYFQELPANAKLKKAIDFYHTQATNYWSDFNLMEKSMIALAKYRNQDFVIAKEILKSLDENSITSETLGKYWKANQAGWLWSQSPIETQALLIEAFATIGSNPKDVEELKIWLLKNKQTNRWETSKATSSAVYALLMNGSDWLKTPSNLRVVVGEKEVFTEKNHAEAGTGYRKISWESSEISPEKACVTIHQQSETPAWGALYWQYFDDLENITPANTHLEISKEIFKKKNTGSGKKLQALTKEEPLKLGDLATTRLVIKTDRDLEFVHLKDSRASCFEPIDVLSVYKYQDGFSYYQSTKDAATNFFIDYLPKGIYVFEYDVRVNNSGDFSSGIATIQNMYAPEFAAHSKGVRLRVE